MIDREEVTAGLQLQTCIICEQSKKDGIQVYSRFICDDCESEIVRTDTADQKYPYFISQLKQIWYKQDA